MKKPIFAAFAALLAVGLISCTQNVKESPTGEITAPHEHVLDRVDTLTAMFNAFCRQESRGDVLAVSPCGRYVGCLQISEIMVREANRVLGDSIYSYDDRYDAGCSYGIFKAVMEHHNPTLNIDKAVDIWNKKAPTQYRGNVKNYYQSILETWQLNIQCENKFAYIKFSSYLCNRKSIKTERTMGYNSYDDWKLANSYDECEGEFVPVEVEVLIFDLGQHVIDEFKNETSHISFDDGGTSLTTTIQVDALLTCDDFEKECYVEDEDVKDAVYEFLGKGCEYEVLNWRRA